MAPAFRNCRSSNGYETHKHLTQGGSNGEPPPLQLPKRSCCTTRKVEPPEPRKVCRELARFAPAKQHSPGTTRAPNLQHTASCSQKKMSAVPPPAVPPPAIFFGAASHSTNRRWPEGRVKICLRLYFAISQSRQPPGRSPQLYLPTTEPSFHIEICTPLAASADKFQSPALVSA